MYRLSVWMQVCVTVQTVAIISFAVLYILFVLNICTQDFLESSIGSEWMK